MTARPQAAAASGAKARRARKTLGSADLRHVVDRDEIARAEALAERLARVMRARLIRRERARRRGRRLDLRRTIHRSVAHGGTPLDLAWRQRKEKPLRLVVLLDASGSMNLYTAFFVRFLHGVVDAFHEAEAFVFHTRLVARVGLIARPRRVARGRPACPDGAGHRRRHPDRRESRRPSTAGTRAA